MAAPLGNKNRLGKKNSNYNLTVPRLKCGTCLAKDHCPIVGKPESACGFLRRLRKQRNELNTLEGIKAVRRQMILETLVQLNIHIMSSENTGISDKNTITFRKMLLDQLAQLEKDEFEQQLKVNKNEDKSDFITSLVKEFASKPQVIDAPFRVEPALEEGDVANIRNKEITS